MHAHLCLELGCLLPLLGGVRRAVFCCMALLHLLEQLVEAGLLAALSVAHSSHHLLHQREQ